MGDTGPRLVSVTPGDDAPEHAAPAPDPGGESARWVLWLLVLLVVVSVFGFALKSRQASQLQGQVITLSEELAESRADVAAYRGRFTQIRASVDDLTAQIGALDALVRDDPGRASD